MFLPVFLSIVALGLRFALPASAHCPLCIAGAGFGLSLSRLLGIDDSITGVWMAALLGSTSFYFSTFTLRKLKIPFKKPLVYIAFFASTLWSFYKFNLVDIHAGDVFGLHKLTYGVLVGAILFYTVDVIDALLIRRHGGVFFPYQRVIVSLGSIFFLSLFNFVLLNYFI